MVNVLKQDATVVVHGTSRYNGNQFDEVSVFTTIVTDGQLTEEYYVPNGNSLSDVALMMIQKHDLEFRPYRESDLLAGTEDFMEQVRNGDTQGTEADMARLLLRSALVKAPLKQVGYSQSTGQYVYEVRYDYKLFPIANLHETYEFHIRLPFDGTTMINGSQVKLNVITPFGAVIDSNGTKGIDENGNEIQEIVQQLANTGKVVTTFEYQIDPIFTIRYQHTTGLFA